MDKNEFDIQLIPAKNAARLSHEAATKEANKTVAELIPVINKAIERACSAGLYYAEIDITKYNHLTLISDALIKELKTFGYEAKLIDDDCMGYYLYITWN